MKSRNLIYSLIFLTGLAYAGPKTRLENGTRVEFENKKVAEKFETVYKNYLIDPYFKKRFPTKNSFLDGVNKIDGNSKDKIVSSDIDRAVNQGNKTLEKELEKVAF